jgi:outer membrane protein assembly factor BamB
VAGDGMLHSLYISNGMEPEPALPFLPPNANAKGLIVLDRIAYAATENCSGASSGVWALDLDSKRVSHWEPSAGTVVGSTGPAFGPDGTVYAAASSGHLAALSGGGLKLMASYTTDGQPFTSSPVVFPYKGKTLVAAATKDGRIHLLESTALGGPDHKAALFKTAAYSSQGFAPSALATWLDADGVRWILAAAAAPPVSSSGFSQTNGSVTNGAIATWRVADHNGAITLEPGWLSRDMISPLTPAVINGVVFAVSSGEFASGENLPVTERVRRSSPAILYALDGATGRKLWDSGRTITSFVHSGGVTGESGQVYLETYDETLYAFGFPTEH